jgi:hypothetical protein
MKRDILGTFGWACLAIGAWLGAFFLGIHIDNRVALSYEQPLPAFDVGYVMRVTDGDTLWADLHWRGEEAIRILGLDAYESRNVRRITKQLSPAVPTREAVLEKGKKIKEIITELLPINTPIIVAFSERRYGVYSRLLGTVLFIHNGEWVDLNDHVRKEYRDFYFNIEEGSFFNQKIVPEESGAAQAD